MSRQMNQACVQRHIDAEYRHDMVATLATLHPECVFVDEALAIRWEGRAGARVHWDGEGHWDGDDLFSGEAHFVGRHVGLFAGIPPTRRSIRLPFVVFVTFPDSLLAGERFISDLNGLLRQPGAATVFEPMAPSAQPGAGA